MNQRQDTDDFRTRRHKLPPDAFAWGPEEPDAAPGDLVEEDVWNSIVSLPDDVSLRASDHHGSQLKVMHELWGSWIESVGEDQECMYYVMADAGDEYQACLFNALCGFYRVGASCLRSALELTCHGTYFQFRSASRGVEEVLAWKQRGKGGKKFKDLCESFRDHPEARRLEDHLCAQRYNSDLPWSVFGRIPPQRASSWAEKLYRELSNYAHSRPGHSSAANWDGSNGPIYVRESFGTVYTLYLETMALCYVLVKLARPSFQLPGAARHLFAGFPVAPSKVAVYSYEFLWGSPHSSATGGRQA
jgi:hypothetical protein